MYVTTSHTKRFPTHCRFFTQGNCRAGQDCHFAHTLPLKGIPHGHNIQHTVLFGDEASLELESEPIQKAVRDLELAQLDRAYKDKTQKITMTDDCTSLLLDLCCGTLELVVPYHYPDLPCSIQLAPDSLLSQKTQQHLYESFESYQHQQHHMTLVQQLDNLCSTFTSS